MLVLDGAGVGSVEDSGSADGGSLPAPVEDDSALEPDVLADAGADGGSTTFSGERAEAATSLTLVAATLPRSTPKPRNTSTSSAETRGGGSLSPEAARAGEPSGAGSGVGGLTKTSGLASPAGSLSRTRASSGSSCGLRGPTRAPHSRQ